MSAKSQRRLKVLRTHFGHPFIPRALFLIFFGGIGSYLLINSFAAANTASFEPDAVTATRTSNIVLVDDGTASAGKAIKFAPAQTSTSSRINGFNFTAYAPEDAFTTTAANSSFDRMVSVTGSNWIAVPVFWYMDTGSSNTIYRKAGFTTSDTALRAFIQRSHSKGIKVMLRPMVDPLDGTWRGDITPTSMSSWQASYAALMYHYATLAASENVEMLAIGAEFNQPIIDTPTDGWWRTTLIPGIKTRYSGPLTYGANMPGTYGRHEPTWLDDLDYLGVDWYMQLARSESTSTTAISNTEYAATDTVAEIIPRWTTFTSEYDQTWHWLQILSDFSARHGNKKILFVEFGYPSMRESLVIPGALYSASGTVDTAIQKTAYEAAFQVLDDKSWYAGMLAWDWFYDESRISANEIDHSPQKKPAEAVFKPWFTK